MTLATDRLRIAMLLTEKLSVRRIAPTDDDYSGTDGHYEFRIEGIAEAAEELAREHDLARRLVESAGRQLDVFSRGLLVPVNDPHAPHLRIARQELTAAIALLKEGKMPAQEGVG